MNLKFSNLLVKCLIIFFVVIAGFILIKNYVPKKNIEVDTKVDNSHFIKIAQQKVKVDLALTEQEQEQGLSGKTSLKDNEGMLFVFGKPSKVFFWMKDMNFIIDMIWISEDMRVIYIKKDAKPESYPDAFGPDQNAKYVLEVASGFSDKNNLKIGDKVELLP